ncbi:MAG TPA: hypothetical protein VFA07_06395 [Chthonomonadaceae bacterium]|nr:hypothetical protein [Chthonomonadaceae bacterium]
MATYDFDYRNVIQKHTGKSASEFNPEMQASFNRITRMANLLSGIDFGHFYTDPIETVVGRIIDNLTEINKDPKSPAFSTIVDSSTALDRLDRLKTGAGRLVHNDGKKWSFYDLAHSKPGVHSVIETVLLELLQYNGIYLPFPGRYDPSEYIRSLSDLIEFAGSHTYREVFEQPEGFFDRNAWYAIHNARRAGVLAEI